MVLFNYSTKEITAKIVYYGPGLCGKTTNLQFIYDNLPGTINKGKMLSLATKTDRTLFFDFLPIDLGTIRGMRTRLQLYTVPGQVFYNTTRKLVLKGADGVVFVADSQKRMIEANLESFRNLEENLAEHDIKIAEMPLIIQFNKRDLPDLLSLDELNAALNKYNAPIYEGVATTGIGVHETLKAITRLVLNSLKERYADKREQRQETPERAANLAAASARAAALQSQPAGAPGPAGPVKPAREPEAPIPFLAPMAPASASTGIVTEKVDSHRPAKLATPQPPLFDLEEPLDASQPLDALFSADEEPILEIVPDADEASSAATDEVFDLTDEVAEESPQALFADLEPVEEPLAASSGSPLELTEQELQIDEPLVDGGAAAGEESIGEFSLDRELSLDLDAEEGLTSGEAGGDTGLSIDLDAGLGISEPDAGFLGGDEFGETPVAAENSPLGQAQALENETASLGEALDSDPLIPAEAPVEPEVTHVSASPLGRQKIDVPVQLQIGDQSIRFHLTISLDIPQLVRPGGNGHGTGSARR